MEWMSIGVLSSSVTDPDPNHMSLLLFVRIRSIFFCELFCIQTQDIRSVKRLLSSANPLTHLQEIEVGFEFERLKPIFARGNGNILADFSGI